MIFNPHKSPQFSLGDLWKWPLFVNSLWRHSWSQIPQQNVKNGWAHSQILVKSPLAVAGSYGLQSASCKDRRKSQDSYLMVLLVHFICLVLTCMEFSLLTKSRPSLYSHLCLSSMAEWQATVFYCLSLSFPRYWTEQKSNVSSAFICVELTASLNQGNTCYSSEIRSELCSYWTRENNF